MPWREGMPSRGTLTGLRGGPLQISWRDIRLQLMYWASVPPAPPVDTGESVLAQHLVHLASFSDLVQAPVKSHDPLQHRTAPSHCSSPLPPSVWDRTSSSKHPGGFPLPCCSWDDSVYLHGRACLPSSHTVQLFGFMLIFVLLLLFKTPFFHVENHFKVINKAQSWQLLLIRRDPRLKAIICHMMSEFRAHWEKLLCIHTLEKKQASSCVMCLD